MPGWLSAADVVCGPALIEPFGQALLEAMACGRSVVATRVGGPPEFVAGRRRRARRPARHGRARARARDRGRAAVTERGRARARRPSTTSGGRRSGWRRSSCEPFEIGEPDLDERADALLEPVLAGDRERLLVALADLLGGDALLEPVVARSASRSWIFCACLVRRPWRIPYAEHGDDRVRVVIADDQRLFAEALEAILSTDARIDGRRPRRATAGPRSSSRASTGRTSS